MTTLSWEPQKIKTLLVTAVGLIDTLGVDDVSEGLLELMAEVDAQITLSESEWPPAGYEWSAEGQCWYRDFGGNDRYSGRMVLGDDGVQWHVWDAQASDHILFGVGDTNLEEATKRLDEALSSLVEHQQLELPLGDDSDR